MYWFFTRTYLKFCCFLKHNISKTNTSNVSTLYNAFKYTSNITNATALADWNVSNVTDMRYMLSMWGITDAQLSDISALANWNVSNVTTMECMFENCSNLTNLSALANWNVSNVTVMRSMFSNCSNLITLDMSGWDTGKIVGSVNFLRDCSKLTTSDFIIFLVLT